MSFSIGLLTILLERESNNNIEFFIIHLKKISVLTVTFEYEQRPVIIVELNLKVQVENEFH